MVGMSKDVDRLKVKSDSYYALPVRSLSPNLPQTGQTASYATGDDGYIQAGVEWPEPRFTDNGDGTVADNLTGLMWLKDGDCLRGSWNDAFSLIANLNSNPSVNNCMEYYAAYSDWRLPNVRELESLSHSGVPDTAAWLNSNGFSDVKAVYWTSTTFSNDNSQACMVRITNGNIAYKSKSNIYYLLLVRAGNIE
jgi:hypothetical protein